MSNCPTCGRPREGAKKRAGMKWPYQPKTITYNLPNVVDLGLERWRRRPNWHPGTPAA